MLFAHPPRFPNLLWTNHIILNVFYPFRIIKLKKRLDRKSHQWKMQDLTIENIDNYIKISVYIKMCFAP
jgi:hypothetical protein